MLNDDIIEPSVSPCSSPVVLVKKSDTDITRFCVDYRELNKVTIKDSFPVPNIEEILDSLGRTNFRLLWMNNLNNILRLHVKMDFSV